jgi:hypothetical protein
MLTSRELNDPEAPRVRRYLPLFRAAEAPAPERGDWSSWQLLLASGASETGDPRDAMCIRTESAYGTVSSSLLALAPDAMDDATWLHAAGAPDEAMFAPVAL